jgi:hypothetical protein
MTSCFEVSDIENVWGCREPKAGFYTPPPVSCSKILSKKGGTDPMMETMDEIYIVRSKKHFG